MTNGLTTILDDSSFVVAYCSPLLGLLFFSVYDRLFDRIIFKSDKHLLLKNLYMKRLALVGIILGGLTLAINYALFSSPFLSSFLTRD